MDINEFVEWLYELYDDDLEGVLYECDLHPYDALRILITEGHMQPPEALKDDFRKRVQS